MASIKGSTRYSSFESRSSTQSHNSDPSSSTDLKSTGSSFKHIIAGAGAKSRGNQSPALQNSSSARAIVKANSTQLATKGKNEPKFTTMVKNFMEKKSKPKAAAAETLLIPVDLIAEDLKKSARKGSNLSTFHRKIFSKGSGSTGKNETKALTDVKSNTRTLAMVLRSERELLSQNRDLETEAIELKLIIEERNREVEKLKDLCIKQREEIKALKSTILFPDLMNSQLQDLLEKQDLELKQAKQLIPSLQRQVTDLTGQINCLAEDLQEVKADQYSSSRGGYYSGTYYGSPETPRNERETLNSLDFSSEERFTPGTPDDLLLLKDFNPCLTPYSIKKKSKEFQGTGIDHFSNEHLYNKTSRNSDSCLCSGNAYRSEGRMESIRWNTNNE
ncbi:uncharacterized protein LOC124915506 [Impatiens glandulifera]|uniref:uncharacterized protein LOC124915506 n=1 Tax=Impatiens glandulifera TaxID=253017 RepID=UPI001FB15CD0|nr:uncharacterized protein LOC124915506 [Impatiens glandulifera]